MAVSYKKLWKLLIDRDMRKKDLCAAAGISHASMAKLGKNENVTTDVLVKICTALQCDIGDIMEMVPPKLIEAGVVAEHKSSPSNSKNAMLGAMLGIVLVCGITVAEELLNDTVQSEEDVEKYLGLTVLASVPLREGEQEEDKNKLTKKQASSRKKGAKKTGGNNA